MENSSHSRQETREGQQRPINKDYYYIDFHATIDAIKYRIFHLTERVKDLYKPSEEKKDFYCPRCKSQYTTLQVLDSVGPMGFICHRCGGILEEESRAAGSSSGHEKQSKLMSQLERLLKLLQQIDSEDIPNNDFEAAFAVMVPVQRNELINPIRATEPLPFGKGPPTGVKGVTQNLTIPLEISLTTSSERTAAEQAAEAQRKADLAAQNVLPVWHTNSTVTGERTANARDHERQVTNGGPTSFPKAEDDEKKGGNILNDELAAYYAQMQQEKEKELREDREADASSDGEEDDDDFEDVGIGASVAASLASSAPNGLKPAPYRSSSKKRESDSGSSAPGTNISTPVGSGLVAEGVEGGLAAKRVKRESQEIEGQDMKQAAGNGAENDSDEDEEAEFEDAL